MPVDLLLLGFSLLASQGEDSRLFSGSTACAGCHPKIAAKQEASNHALSLRRAAAVPQMSSNLPIQIETTEGGKLSLVPGTAMPLLRYGGGSVPTLRLEWAFGSGAKGVTPLGRTESGEYREGRLSWFRSLNGFALTPGASRHSIDTAADQLGRLLSSAEVRQCFSCHTTGLAAGGLEPAAQETGIRCESCHGPGRKHVVKMSASSSGDALEIVQPGKLTALEQVTKCGGCHGSVPNDTDIAAIRAIEANPNTARFPSTRLVLSRCFNESASGIKCTQCHDPHGNVETDAARISSACRDCHNPVKLKNASCRTAKAACGSCHMPSVKVMAYSEFADHWIRIPTAETGVGHARR